MTLIKTTFDMIERYKDCKDCNLCNGRKNVVFGEGTLPCRLLIIGEAPGTDEDMFQRPFIGKAGVLLRTTLSEVGITLADCFITNAVACIPRNESKAQHVSSFRKPTHAEISACSPRIRWLLQAAEHSAILTLGQTAYCALRYTEEDEKGNEFDLRRNLDTLRMNSIRGWQPGSSLNDAKVMSTFHPSYVLRSWPNAVVKEQWKGDIMTVRDYLDNSPVLRSN